MKNFLFSLLLLLPISLNAGSLLIGPTVIYNAQDIASSVDSKIMHVLYSDNIGVQLVWTGSPTGQFGISGSDTCIISATGAISGCTWTAITGTYPAPAGSASNGLIGVTNFPHAFIKVTYVASSGTGAVTAKLVAKPL